MKIHELITMLRRYDPQAEVLCTWESQITDLDVYQAADGRILIDADGCSDKIMWQETKCEVCGELANGRPYVNKAVCYEHWNTFKEVLIPQGDS